MTNEKPCPFCGSGSVDVEVVDSEAAIWIEYVVVCKNCGAKGPNDLSPSAARHMWNLRREPKVTIGQEEEYF